MSGIMFPLTGEMRLVLFSKVKTWEENQENLLVKLTRAHKLGDPLHRTEQQGSCSEGVK